MIRADVHAGRRLAREMLRDRCRTTRQAGPRVLDPDTGALATATVEVYSGPCRVRSPDLAELRRTFSERVATVTKYVVIVPWDAPPHEVGDVIELVETEDVQLASRRLRVVGIPMSTLLMFRPLAVEVVE